MARFSGRIGYHISDEPDEPWPTTMLLSGKGSGKTHATMAWAARDHQNRVVLCATPEDAENLRREYEHIFPTARVEHVGPGSQHLIKKNPNIQYAVNDVDQVIAMLYGKPPHAMTMNGGNDDE